jgi:YidC/Oxa1 family membrane protein insertase
MGGGCLWSLVPLLILWPMLALIREPIVYILGETAENAAKIVEAIKTAAPELFTGNTYYDQVVAARHIPEFLDAIKEAVPAIGEKALSGINFDFIGIDLGLTPSFNIFDASWKWDWAHIGGALIPLMSAGTNLLSMFIAQKMNNSLVTDKNGVQDEETAKKSQANQSMNTMMWMMPIMSIWFGFSMPAAVTVYWIAQAVFGLIFDSYLTIRYRKDYADEDEIRRKKAAIEAAAEAEKERIRAERRAANPEGIVENTSKKKLERKEREEREEAARRFALEKAGIDPDAVKEVDMEKCPSGIPERPFCKGRNYDPNRYSKK